MLSLQKIPCSIKWRLHFLLSAQWYVTKTELVHAFSRRNSQTNGRRNEWGKLEHFYHSSVIRSAIFIFVIWISRPLRCSGSETIPYRRTSLSCKMSGNVHNKTSVGVRKLTGPAWAECVRGNSQRGERKKGHKTGRKMAGSTRPLIVWTLIQNSSHSLGKRIGKSDVIIPVLKQTHNHPKRRIGRGWSLWDGWRKWPRVKKRRNPSILLLHFQFTTSNFSERIVSRLEFHDDGRIRFWNVDLLSKPNVVSHFIGTFLCRGTRYLIHGRVFGRAQGRVLFRSG